MRAFARHLLECMLVYGGIAHGARIWHRGDTIILGYHNIVPIGEQVVGDRSLHLTQEDFAAQLDLLQRTHDVVPLEALRLAAEPGSRPRVAITFDDAYLGALTAGLEELERRGMPATVFVTPAFVDGGSFWWDAFSTPAGLSSELRDRALTQLGGRDDAVRSWAETNGVEEHPVPDHARAAPLEVLRRAARMPGITFGSHTWSHPNLATLSEAEVRDELVRSMDWLREHVGSPIPWLAYPYGQTSQLVQQVAAELGFEGAVLIGGGFCDAQARSPQALPRLTVPAGVSREGFVLRAAGVVT